MKRFEAIYARQSVFKEESKSIEAQIKECKKHCDEKPRIYSDKGFSGGNTDRPAFQELKKAIDAGIIKKVIVYKVDRISRNTVDFDTMWQDMKAKDCAFISCCENFDTSTPMGEAMLKILSAFAEMERNNIQQRIKDNYDYRITQHTYPTGSIPFGYERTKGKEGKGLKPVNEEINAIKEIFKMYATDLHTSLGDLKRYLEDNKIKTKKGSASWGLNAIDNILKNPLYAPADKDMYEFAQQEGIIPINPKDEWTGENSACISGRRKGKIAKIFITNVEPIISTETFLIVQHRLKQNSAFGPNNKPNNNMLELSGFLRCSECGRTIKMHKKPTLYCLGRTQYKDCTASFKGKGRFESIRKDVDGQVAFYLSQYRKKRMKIINQRRARAQRLEDIAVLLERYNERWEKADKDDKEEIVYCENKIKELKSEQSKIRLHTIIGDKDDIIEQRLIKNPEIVKFFDISAMDYTKLTSEQKQMIMKEIVQKIVVNPTGSVIVYFKD